MVWLCRIDPDSAVYIGDEQIVYPPDVSAALLLMPIILPYIARKVSLVSSGRAYGAQWLSFCSAIFVLGVLVSLSYGRGVCPEDFSRVILSGPAVSVAEGGC